MSEEEKKALKIYFDNTNVNVTSLVKKVGLKDYKKFQKILNKIYEDG